MGITPFDAAFLLKPVFLVAIGAFGIVGRLLAIAPLVDMGRAARRALAGGVARLPARGRRRRPERAQGQRMIAADGIGRRGETMRMRPPRRRGRVANAGA